LILPKDLTHPILCHFHSWSLRAFSPPRMSINSFRIQKSTRFFNRAYSSSNIGQMPYRWQLLVVFFQASFLSTYNAIPASARLPWTTCHPAIFKQINWRFLSNKMFVNDVYIYSFLR
jgi:hypothetical protein